MLQFWHISKSFQVAKLSLLKVRKKIEELTLRE